MTALKLFLEKELGLSKEVATKVTGFYEKREIAKNTFLVKSEQYCKEMYLIDTGYIRFFSYSDRKEITHWIFSPHQLVTDIASFFLHQLTKWNIQTLTDTTVFVLKHSSYQRLIKEVPEWNRYEKLFLIKLMSALENRIYTLLSMSAEERYQYLLKADSNMFNTIPLQYLASMLRMSPETLSRVRSKFIS